MSVVKVCEHIKVNGEQCRGPAIWGLAPPRCAMHRQDGGPEARLFQKGNQYGHLYTKHGFNRRLFSDFRSIEEKAADILLKHEQLSICLAQETEASQRRILFGISLENLASLIQLLKRYQQWTGEHPDRLLERANGEPKARLRAKLETLRRRLEKEVTKKGYSTTDKRSPRYWLIYDFMVGYIEQHGVSPTINEIKKACDIPSKGSVTYWLEKLEKDGLIVRPRRRVWRGIKLGTLPSRRPAG